MAVALSGLGRLLAGFLTEPAHVHGAAQNRGPSNCLPTSSPPMCCWSKATAA